MYTSDDKDVNFPLLPTNITEIKEDLPDLSFEGEGNKTDEENEDDGELFTIEHFSSNGFEPDNNDIMEEDSSDGEMIKMDSSDISTSETDPFKKKHRKASLDEQRFHASGSCECWKITYTILISLSYICLGISDSISSPLQHQLSENVGVDVTEFGTMVTMKFLGHIIGSIFNPAVFNIHLIHRISRKYCSERRLIIILLILHGIVIFSVPVFQSYNWLVFNYFIQGLLSVTICIGMNILTVGLWGYSTDPPLQFVHGSYAVGLAFFPFITTWVVAYVEDSRSQLFILYFSEGVLLVLSALFLLIPMDIYIVMKGYTLQSDLALQRYTHWREEKKGEKKLTFKSVAWESLKFVISVTMLVWTLCSLLYFVSVAIYEDFANYIGTYIEKAELGSTETVSWLVFAFWISIAVGRLSNVLFILLLRSVYCLACVHVCAIFVIYIFLIFTNTNLVMLFVLTVLLGLAVGPLNPYAVGMSLNFYNVPITVISVSLIHIASNFGALVGSLIISEYQVENMETMFYFGLAVIGIGILLMIVMGFVKCCLLWRGEKNIVKNFCK